MRHWTAEMERAMPDFGRVTYEMMESGGGSRRRHGA